MLQDENLDIGDAVYGRTPAGQQELVSPSGGLSPVESRLLAALTGFTPMRVFTNLGFEVPRDAIETLHSRRLIAEQIQSGSRP